VAVRESGFGESLLKDQKPGKACLSWASVKTALNFASTAGRVSSKRTYKTHFRNSVKTTPKRLVREKT
jgi:hypothetical protein